MTYLPHQIKWSELAYSKIKDYGFVIIGAQERTGKTGTFLRVVEISSAQTCLILTKKNAIPSIQQQIQDFNTTKTYTVTNYQSVHKLASTDYDVIILDEFHDSGVQGYPKPSATLKALRSVTYDKPIIYVSATPFSESYAQVYHALSLSSWSPFRHKTFYMFHREFGVEASIYMNGRQMKQYNIMQDAEVKRIISKYLITATRKDLGFKQEPVDQLHVVKLDAQTKADIKMYKAEQMKHFKETPVPLDSTMAEANAVYLRGGGFVEHDKGCYQLSSEKIDYLLSHFGDIESVAVMAHYRCEQKFLSSILKRAKVLSSTADAEGVDLHKIDTLVIYSLSFSTSKHIQRRARQANVNRKDPIIVHFLLTDAGLDKHVYETVDKKHSNFTARMYERTTTSD